MSRALYGARLLCTVNSMCARTGQAISERTKSMTLGMPGLVEDVTDLRS